MTVERDAQNIEATAKDRFAKGGNSSSIYARVTDTGGALRTVPHTSTACVRQLEDMAYAAVNEAADLGTQTRWGADHNAGAMPEVLMAMIEENVRAHTPRHQFAGHCRRGCCLVSSAKH